jgi:hypothetical protein
MQSIESVIAFLHALAKACLRHFIVVVLSVIVCVAGAAGIAVNRPPVYTASMTVKAVDTPTGGRIANRLAVGALAGSLPTYFKVMQSRPVAQLLIDNEHIENVLFWGAGRDPKPSADEVQHVVAGFVTVDRDMMSDLATVNCTAPNPALCAALLAAMHRQTEFRLRQMMLQQATAARDYVTRVLPKTTDADMRATLTDTLQTADTQIVAADLREPIGAVVLDPPVDPPTPLHRRLAMTLAAAALLGLALGMGIAWLLEARRGAAR